MKINLKQQTEYLESRVGIDIYVWGGNGETIIMLMPKLADMEKSGHSEKEALKNVDRDLTLLQKRLLQDINLFIIRGVDCSGLIVRYLRDIIEFIKSDMTADGLYKLALANGKEVDVKDAKEGDYLFQGSADNKWHTGVAVSDKYAVESKNRDEGVCKTVIAERGWNYCVRPDWYDEEKPILARELYLTDPNMEGEDVKDCQRLLIDKGYNPGKVDGIYGKATEMAVKNFQTDNKLDIKRFGTVGKKTAKALGFIWEG